MYLRGIQYSEMESIIQFIYLGEATLYEERTDEFLAVANSLEIKELYNPKLKSEHDEEFSISDQQTSTDKMQEKTDLHFNNHDQKTFSSSLTLSKHKQSINDDVKNGFVQILILGSFCIHTI